ncbi:MAG: ATP-binding protein [Ignavibacteriae bacterium]|nr:ATP-binding protein [Ignavibacteriota bacterium]
MPSDISTQAEKKLLNISSAYYLKQFDFEEEILRSFVASGYSSIEHVRGCYIMFDLSRSYWYELGTLLWFISLLHKLRKQGNDIQLVLPEPEDSKSENLLNFLTRWRFFETLKECVDDPVNLLKPNQLWYTKKEGRYKLAVAQDEYGSETILHNNRLLEITTILSGKHEFHDDSPLSRFLNMYYHEVIISALSKLCGWDASITKKFFQHVITEGLRNSIEHSEGNFSNISMRLDKKNLTLAIADNGIGIPTVLRNAFKESSTHKDLLQSSDADLIKFFTEPKLVLELRDSRLINLSVQKGITSKRGRKGFGLYYLKSFVLSQGGELRIRSGKACVDFANEREEPRDNMMESPGTMLRIQTPLK